MKFSNHISAAQKKFIRDLRNGKLTLEELKKWESDRPKYFTRWFRNRYFWMNLKKAMRESERRADVEVHLIAIEARQWMAEGVRDKANGLKPDHLATCASAQEQHRANRKLAQSRPRRRKRKPRVDPQRDLAHPRFKHEEAELLAVLREGRAAPSGS